MYNRLNRNDHDKAWFALARRSGVSEDVARLLWTRAEAEAAYDPIKVERLFRRMLADLKALDALGGELGAHGSSAAVPGKWTRVLLEQQRPTSGAIEQAEAPATSPSAQLRQALEAVIKTGESAARTLAISDARTVSDVVRQLRDSQGAAALAVIDNGTLGQMLRLVDAMVSMVEHGRDDTVGKPLRRVLRGRHV
jgi:hypothetical protein